jgi:hypothetical protein
VIAECAGRTLSFRIRLGSQTYNVDKEARAELVVSVLPVAQIQFRVFRLRVSYTTQDHLL